MRIILSVLFAVLAAAAAAAPRTYALDPSGSQVVFTWFLGADAVDGQMAVKHADLTLDFAQASNSSIDVALDAGSARAGFAFATSAMRGPGILNAGAFPEIRFRSTRISGHGTGADVRGDLTIRGVTRPVLFNVTLYKGQGSIDSSRLAVLLTGKVNRFDFGADGWSDMVGDKIEIKVLAQVSRTD